MVDGPQSAMERRRPILLSRLLLLVVVLYLLSDVEAGQEWDRYKKKFKKVYQNEQVDKKKMKTWTKNRKIINEHNEVADEGFFHHRLKETALTDYNKEEFKRLAMTVPPPDLLASTRIKPFSSIQFNGTIPDFVDYRNNPCMPAIKFQRSCGCCWAFAATCPIEYQACAKNNNSIPLNLSEQQLVDCSWSQGNKGCNGGWYEKAWDYLKISNGQVSNVTYPYAAKNGTCKLEGNAAPLADVVDYIRVGQNNETALKVAVAVLGPVSVAICGTCASIQNYGSGIYEDPNCNCPVNHGVVIVGYGTSFGTDYWIVRNTWGKNWGLAGYALFKRGINQSNIAYWPSVPIIA